LDVRRIDKVMDKSMTKDGKEVDAGSDIVGNRTRVKVVKNKVAPPFRQAEFDILYATGISKEGEILDLAVKYNIVEKSGAYFRYGEETIGQGREQARLNMIQSKDLTKKLEKEVRDIALAADPIL
jgi:recombination protein RecA